MIFIIFMVCIAVLLYFSAEPYYPADSQAGSDLQDDEGQGMESP